MKTVGLIGGLSWVSSLDYYRILNETTNARLGGLHAAKIILFSVNYGEIKALTDRGDWAAITNIMIDAAQKLESSGADCILLGANTMHKIAKEIQEAIAIPIIHIAEVVAAAISKSHLNTVGLLGTRFTMELDFYNNKLLNAGIKTIIPELEERDFIHSSIYNELGKGIFLPETKARYLEVINRLIRKGAGGIILGCTEIPMMIRQEDCAVPVFDTTMIHCLAGVDFALKDMNKQLVNA